MFKKIINFLHHHPKPLPNCHPKPLPHCHHEPLPHCHPEPVEGCVRTRLIPTLFDRLRATPNFSLKMTIIFFIKIKQYISGDFAYENYLKHYTKNHPHESILSKKDFLNKKRKDSWSRVNRCC